MTLLLTALMPENIVQVSDRRVVWQYSDGSVVLRDDRAVKAVLTPQVVVAFTGLANLGPREDTGEWIAVHLSDHVGEPDGGLVGLGQAAEIEMRKMGAEDQPLMIVAAGWAKADDGTVFAKATEVSNMHGGNSTEFRVAARAVRQPRESGLLTAGQRLYTSEGRRVSRDVARLVARNRASPRAVAQVLTEANRAVAKGPGDRRKFVSEDVLVTSFPRPDLRKHLYPWGALEPGLVAVAHIDAGSSRRERYGGPLVVGDGGVSQPLPPEDAPPSRGGVSAAVRIVRKPDEGSVGVFLPGAPAPSPAWTWPGKEPDSA